jgi:lipopolysaccharide transport system ATP-binding protein
MSELVLRAERLSKSYRLYAAPRHRIVEALFRGRKKLHREVWALFDVDLELRRGETLGVIGRNGAGKSTLLQLLTGTLEPTLGTVEKHGRVAALLELGAGFNPDFTGRENVYVNAAVLGLRPEQIEERFESIVAFSELSEHIDYAVRTYSSGMYMRLAFSVAAHVDADMLIIDEALSVGDVFFAQKCMRFLREFQKRGSVLFVSHDLTAILGFCDRVLWLEDGRTRRMGAPKEVVEEYLGSSIEATQDALQPPAPQSSDATPPAAPDVEGGPEVAEAASEISVRRASLFRPRAAFGRRGARIADVRLEHEDGRPVLSAGGGEQVTLAVEIESSSSIASLIVGFFVKDRLGQYLFGDNTCLTRKDDPLTLPSSARAVARFRFEMPYLASGDYTIAVSVADGTQESHVQHEWIHDALAFHVAQPGPHRGLVGIPIRISLSALEPMPSREGVPGESAAGGSRS